MQQSIKIFCSCASESPRDKYLINRLMTHLDNLERQIQVKVWYPQKIAPGVDSRQEINENLKSADIILICVSPDYMASERCFTEAMRAVKLGQMGRSAVRVILLQHADWKYGSLGRCKFLPMNGKFVSDWSNKDEVFRGIVQDIKELVQSIRLSRTVQERGSGYFGIPPSETSTFVLIDIPPNMAPIESLRRDRQTDEISVRRHTEEPKVIKRTEELERGKLRAKEKDDEHIFAAEDVSSISIPTRRKKALPRTGRKRSKAQNSRRSSSAESISWGKRVQQEYQNVSSGNQGIIFYVVLILDVLGVPTAILYGSNSWGLFGLAIFISLLIFIGGTINTDGLIAILPSLLYAGFWGMILYHFSSLHLLLIIAIAGLVFLVHSLLFRGH